MPIVTAKLREQRVPSISIFSGTHCQSRVSASNYPGFLSFRFSPVAQWVTGYSRQPKLFEILTDSYIFCIREIL